jgi:hypothetical protein
MEFEPPDWQKASEKRRRLLPPGLHVPEHRPITARESVLILDRPFPPPPSSSKVPSTKGENDSDSRSVDPGEDEEQDCGDCEEENEDSGNNCEDHDSLGQ